MNSLHKSDRGFDCFALTMGSSSHGRFLRIGFGGEGSMTDEAGERLGAVEKELTSLGRDVAKLRILVEENARTIKLIAEGHGAKFDSLGRRLDDVFTALEPLQQMKDFFERVADDHELRIMALEKREG